MATKKVYRLKSSTKKIFGFFVVFIILCIFVGNFISKKVEEYNYTKTYEYKLLNIGYNDDDISILTNKLNDNELDDIILRGYDEFIPSFVNCKYFMYKNLDGYLSQVITQEDDFFKYHGTTGYDYDNIVSVVNTHNELDKYSGDFIADTSLNYSVLVNKYYHLSSDYVPDDLVDIPLKYYYGSQKQIRSAVLDAFISMWNDAYNEGYYLVILTAYRSYDEQNTTYTKYENLKGTKYADSYTVRPGYTEHQTGLALNIYSKDASTDDTFKDTDAYNWLVNNSYKYGFILRYPEDKKNITGFKYESGHFRYLGIELATRVHNSGLTYDEYYAYYIE